MILGSSYTELKKEPQLSRIDIIIRAILGVLFGTTSCPILDLENTVVSSVNFLRLRWNVGSCHVLSE